LRGRTHLDGELPHAEIAESAEERGERLPGGLLHDSAKRSLRGKAVRSFWELLPLF
jgi:hypothetical protein